MLSSPLSTRHRVRLLAAAGIGLAGGWRFVTPATAHQASDSAGTPSGELAITLRAMDFSFEVPAEVPAGWVQVTLKNDGAEDHHAQIISLPEGMTAEDALGMLATQGEAEALASVTLAGGPAAVAPGGVSKAVVQLEPGEHLIICAIPGPDGVPHVAKGMFAAFTVTPNAEASAPPKADYSVAMNDFVFSIPNEVEAKTTVFEAVNDGTEAHEFALYRLADGITPNDVLTILGEPAATPAMDEHHHESPVAAPPPPIIAVGGFQAIHPGGKGYAVIDLEPATYAATCFVPSVANGGAPHIMLGMVAFFEAK
jgi:uncharacterized cupredoxin-like copper-binding protein